MPSEIITTDDLREFKTELFSELKKLFDERHGQPTKKWLKSFEVRKMLGVSPGTLQNMRINGTLPFTKMGGILFYDSAEIQKILESNKEKKRKIRGKILFKVGNARCVFVCTKTFSPCLAGANSHSPRL